MLLYTTELPGVILIEPQHAFDSNGDLTELVDLGFDGTQGNVLSPFVQDSGSLSSNKNTLRGLHFQRPPHAQAKLVRCAQGALLDVAVDVRNGSPYYGRWQVVELSVHNRRRLYIPEGFLHGFLTLEDDTVVEYKCSDFYSPECDGAVRWDSLGIDWGTTDPILSDKDAAAVPFADFKSPFEFGLKL
jgi:dTDP-4-dehydrorhamnose 3,5-epimerase